MELVLDWRGIGVIAVIWIAWSGALFGLIKWLLDRYANGIQQRFVALEQQKDKRREEIDKLEKDFLRHKADLPLHYVRREDYVRGQSVIEAKLDALASKLEITRLEAAKNDD